MIIGPGAFRKNNQQRQIQYYENYIHQMKYKLCQTAAGKIQKQVN